MQSLFAILGLPEQFPLDLKALETAYFAAQRACHPDRFVGKPEAERLAAITHSQMTNDAYDTLKNPLRRAEHLLELQGIFALDDEVRPPAELLMEVMELREALSEAAQDGASLAVALDDLKKRANDALAQIEADFAAKDYAAATAETMRLQYLGKAMEEAHMLIYRLKANHSHG